MGQRGERERERKRERGREIRTTMYARMVLFVIGIDESGMYPFSFLVEFYLGLDLYSLLLRWNSLRGTPQRKGEWGGGGGANVRKYKDVLVLPVTKGGCGMQRSRTHFHSSDAHSLRALHTTGEISLRPPAGGPRGTRACAWACRTRPPSRRGHRTARRSSSGSAASSAACRSTPASCTGTDRPSPPSR